MAQKGEIKSSPTTSRTESHCQTNSYVEKVLEQMVMVDVVESMQFRTHRSVALERERERERNKLEK